METSCWRKSVRPLRGHYHQGRWQGSARRMVDVFSLNQWTVSLTCWCRVPCELSAQGNALLLSTTLKDTSQGDPWRHHVQSICRNDKYYSMFQQALKGRVFSLICLVPCHRKLMRCTRDRWPTWCWRRGLGARSGFEGISLINRKNGSGAQEWN